MNIAQIVYTNVFQSIIFYILRMVFKNMIIRGFECLKNGKQYYHEEKVISSEINYLDIPSKLRDHANSVGVHLLTPLVVLEMISR